MEWLSKNINTKNTLSVLHFNTRSIPKNKNLIEELISALNHNPDVIAVTETKLNMSNIDVSPMQNYTVVYSNSKSNWGGVRLYVANYLSCKSLNYR